MSGQRRYRTRSLPVLLRHLFELDTDERAADVGMFLAGDILMTLGFDEYGRFVAGMRRAWRNKAAAAPRLIADIPEQSRNPT